MEEEGSISKYAERLQAAVLQEFRSSEVPVARINYFAVYRACLETMHAISDANHEKDPGYICKCTPESCLYECSVELKRRLVRSGKRVSMTDKKPACDSCCEHLLKVFGGRQTSEFLWDV